MPVYVALLRGINLAGHHKVAMAELKQLFAGLGFADVATYIQSGNVVFASDSDDVAALTADIERGLLRSFGFEVPVAIRSGPQLADVAAANPFLGEEEDVSLLSVGFLGSVPEDEMVRRLRADPLADPAATGGDAFALVGHEIYLRHPNGYGRTKLTNAFFDKRLGTMMTVRNWRSVTRLLEMAGGG